MDESFDFGTALKLLKNGDRVPWVSSIIDCLGEYWRRVYD
jgi:hypothetical protein